MIRAPIRSRQDLYANPNVGLYGSDEYDPATQGVFRSRSSQERLRWRPESLRSGMGVVRTLGQGPGYVSGIGKPVIDIEDIGGRTGR